MTGSPVRARSVIALCVVALAILAAALPTSAAGAEPRQPKATGPSALWKAYPLNPRASRAFLGTYRPGVLPTSGADDVKSPIVITLLLMVIAASSAFLLRPAVARVPIGRSTGRVRQTPERVDVRRSAHSTNSATARESAFEERRLGTCEMRLWRGQGICQLYATTGRDDEAIAMSRSFRLGDSAAPNANALRALADLRRRLEDAGWLIASGRDWYEREPSGRVRESRESSGGGGI
jgi:hypothetical protein